MKSKQILVSQFELDNAKFFGVPVFVTQKGETIDYGKITKQTDECVCLNGGYYIKGLCTFVVA